MLYHRKKRRETHKIPHKSNPMFAEKSKLRKIREQKTFLSKKKTSNYPICTNYIASKSSQIRFFTHFSAYAAFCFPPQALNFVPTAFFHANIAVERHRRQPFSHFSPFLFRSWTLYLSPYVIIQNVGSFSYSFCPIKSKKGLCARNSQQKALFYPPRRAETEQNHCFT